MIVQLIRRPVTGSRQPSADHRARTCQPKPFLTLGQSGGTRSNYTIARSTTTLAIGNVPPEAAVVMNGVVTAWGNHIRSSYWHANRQHQRLMQRW
jgi:hypothetical protein